ncbi:MAG TPA: tetratricopeptide repeat protein [Candidatus Obscuribacterales bacterium]
MDKIHHALKHGQYKSAAKKARKLAENGHAKAQTILGLLYENGLGVEKDMERAIFWMEKAASQGVAEAENHLGHLYLEGKSIEKDLARAEHWLAKAAEHGVSEAQLHLGTMYLRGHGVKKDINHAAILLRRAADQGSDEAREMMERVPVLKQASDAAKASGQGYSQGLYDLRDSWKGYADIVNSVNSAASGEPNNP